MNRIIKPKLNLKGNKSDTLVVAFWNPQAFRVNQRGREVWNGGWLLTCSVCGQQVTARTSQVKAKTVRCACRSKRALKDLKGKRFGRLQVLSRAENKSNGKAQWLCRCDCGQERMVTTDKLSSGRQVSCGCSRKDNEKSELRRERQKEYFKKHRLELLEAFIEACRKNGVEVQTTPEEFEKFRSTQQTKLKFRCIKHRHEFELAWFNMQNHVNCRVCNAFRSKAEAEMYEWIVSEYHGPVFHNYKKLNGVFEVDIFCPEKNLAIDYNGLFTHSEYCRDKNYHYKKRQTLEKLGITFIQVNADEWDYKKEIVKSMLRSRLGLLSDVTYARKLKVVVPCREIVLNFLQHNHLMGQHVAGRPLGLEDGDGNLFCVMTYQVKKNVLDISRYCTKLNHSVPGGFSKLLAVIEKEFPDMRMESAVDLRYATGQSLLKTGFTLHRIVLGWKWTDCNNTYNRLACRAGMDERKLSQKEYAKEKGWLKIYDAGQAYFRK